MKIITKLLLAAFIFCVPAAQANYLYKVVPYYFMWQLGAAAVNDSVQMLTGNVSINHKLESAADLPVDVLQWAQQKLMTQGIESKAIKFKQLEAEHFIFAFYDTIVIKPAIVAQISAALSSNDPALQDALGIWSTLLDHEIAHVINKDSKRFMACSLATSAIALGAAAYLATCTNLKSVFVDPQNFNECMKSEFAIVGVSLAIALSKMLINFSHSRHRESLADDYAVTQAKESQPLRATADFFKIFYENIINKRHNINMELTDTQRHALSWLIDPAHPSYTSRIKKFNEAAEKLEARQLAEQAIAA